MAGKAVKKKKINSSEMQEILIENFVGLQGAMANLAEKFEDLADQISKLLNIFEMSAKNIVDEGPDLRDKIDQLLDQNQTIATGLVILEHKLQDMKVPRPIRGQIKSIPKSINKPKALPRI